ncbi:MAG TPA: alpha/beta fold hydrolase, partial [Candidatus Eisenbacteria bacterium]|nr:alpha/beta fold hydrolase [Candidatus Eisenbacteria bacterium]
MDGRRLHWIETGRGRPVVLLHGLGHSAQAWGHVVPALARRRRVLAVDLPGFGHSEASPRRPLLEGYAHVVAEWLQAVAGGPATVVGHSMGGSTAAHLAASRPDLLSGVVLVAPAGIVGTPAWWRIVLVQRHVRQLLAPALLVSRPALNRASVALGYRWIGFHGLDRSSLDHIRAFSSGLGTRKEIAALLETAEALVTSLAAPAPHVPPGLPGLVIWGRRDRLVPSAHAPAVAERSGARVG